jgi:hypothetical protein
VGVNALRSLWIVGVVGLLAVIAAGSIWFVRGELGALGQVLGVIGVIGLLAYGVLDRDRLAAEASTREVFASSSAALVLVLALVLGVVGVALVRGWDQTRDISRAGGGDLSPRTRAVLESLDGPVEIYGLFRRQTPQRKALDRLGALYASASPQVTYTAVDPLTEPARARALLKATGNEELDRVADAGAVVIVAGGRNRRIESDFEQTRITNAIVKLRSDQDRLVCWSVGHGERGPDDDQTARGYGLIVLRLEDRNVSVREVRVATQGVDRACDLLLIAGPTADFEPRALEAIAAFVAEGGQVVALLDNPLLEAASTPALDGELRRYGIAVDADVILENDPDHVLPDQLGEPLFLYSPRQFSQHPVLDALPAGIAVRWPRSARSSDDRPGVVVRNLISSSSRSWADRTYTRAPGESPEADPDEQLGPVPFVALAEVLDPDVLEVRAAAVPDPTDTVDAEAGEPSTLAFDAPRASLIPLDFAPKPGGRVLVIGDADFGANALSTLFDNGDLLLSAIAFLIGDEDQVGSDAEPHQFLILSTAQLALLFLIGVLFIPGAAAVAGGVLVVRRRFL